MVKNTKDKKSAEQPKVKVVKYTYPDGGFCTVVTPDEPATQPTEPIPATSFNLEMTTFQNNMKNSTNVSTKSNSTTAPAAVSSTKPATRTYSDLRSGVKKQEAMDIVHNYAFPDRPFTIKEVLLGTGINHWYVSTYIKTNAKVVGNAPKQPGERGKVAKLYQIEKRA
jgi:nitrate reductase alpha subunit